MTTRRIQAVALDLFEARGFDATSIEDVARAADVAPATIYRAFATKEGIVLWDEYDPMLLAAFARHLTTAAPAQAMLAALVESLAEVYDRDEARILRRTRLMRRTPAIVRAATTALGELRQAVAQAIGAARRARDGLEAQVFAGALVATLEVAIDRWLEDDGRVPLARCLRLAFARLARVGSAPRPT